MEKLRRDIFLLGLISFFTDASSEVIMPILGFFIESLGGSGLIIGLIFGFGDGIANFLKVFSGYVSDRIGRRKIFISSGYTLSAISKLFFPFSTHWSHIFFLRSVERMGKGIRGAPRDALIGDMYIERRGEAYGFHRAMDTAGAVVGSLLAFLLFWLLGIEEKTILMIAGVMAFFAIPPIVFLRERAPSISKREKIELEKPLKKFIAISSLFYLGNFSYVFFLLRIAKGTQYGEAFALLLYAFFNIVYASFSKYFGKLSDRIGRKFVISMGYIIFSLLCFGFIFIPSFGEMQIPLSFILFFAYGIVFALIEGNQRAFVSDLSKYRGTAQGAYQLCIGMANIPASIIAGFLWDKLPELTFIYGASLAILSASLLSAVEIEKLDTGENVDMEKSDAGIEKD